MSLDSIKWQPTCCAFHGVYAEHPTKDGGVMRIKQAPDGVLTIMRFGADKRAIDADANGPAYRVATRAEIESLMA